MNPICKACGGKCCRGITPVVPTDEIYNDDDLVCDSEFPDFKKRMRTDEKSNCGALKDGLCTIYEKRPQFCRDFEVEGWACKLFQIGGEVNVPVTKKQCST
jgi:Fe-S-cluster containining protein